MGKRVDPQQIAKARAEVERWKSLRDKARREMEDAEVRVQAGEQLLSMLLGQDAAADSAPGKMKRGAVKDHVLRLVTENAGRGLVSSELVELAKAQGIELDRGTVSSLLSKLKAEGVLDYLDGKYRPAKPASPRQPPAPGAGMHLPGGALHAPVHAI